MPNRCAAIFALAACATAPVAPRVCGPDQPLDLAAVHPLKVQVPGFPAHVPHEKEMGAVLAVRSGLSADALQAQVDCHLAAHAPGLTARVRPEGAPGRFLVELRSAHATTAREVLARADFSLTDGAHP